MTSPSTTIRVSVAQRERLKALAAQRSETMTETMDAALEALHRDGFYRAMAVAEAELRADGPAWDAYQRERAEWLNADLA